ncbi:MULTISPECIES: hypothetical protein [unclassified Agromyces]|uniref:hypothetical protein n=1 Tax=unclassified Agromyces TaxID=2639701 RepID=UPI0030151A57
MGELSVRGGGSVSVETEALLAEAARLSTVAHILHGWAARACGIRDRLGELGPGELGPGLAGLAAGLRDLDTASAGFRAGEAECTALSWSLVASAGGYAAADWLATVGREAGTRLGAGLLGVVAPGLLLAGASASAIIAPGVVLGSLLAGPGAASAGLAALVEQHGLPILSDPAFVAMVRAAGGNLDEFLAGLFRSGGLFGVGAALDAPENAALLVGAASASGLVAGTRGLRETEVRVERRMTPRSAVSPFGPPASAPPHGVGDLAERIPAGPPGEPQIRIERYEGDDGPRWIVYSSGTVDFGVVPEREPYDSTSNLHSVADASASAGSVGLPPQPGAGERSVRAAMEAAGIAPGDPVLVVGHSAGGIIAANLAADPRLSVVGAVSFGGPVAQVPSGSTPVLSVEHAEDLVPATAGTGVAADGRLVVERSLGRLEPTLDDPLPAHALAAYRGTADAVDASEDPRLRDFARLVGDLTGGSPATTTEWHAERVPGAETLAPAAPGPIGASRADAPPGRSAS